MAVPNVFFHDTGPAGKMTPLSVGDDGKAIPLDELDIDSFELALSISWRQLIDGWSCTSCANAKMYVLHMPRVKSESMQVIHDVRNYANEHAPILLSGEQPEKHDAENIR